MKYKLLGKTGLRVSELCLGTMSFGEEWGWGSNKEVSNQVFDAYANSGGNFLDTANFYTHGTSEKNLGEFVHSNRDHFVLATKYALYDSQNDPNFCGNHKKNMIRSLEASLKRLKTDYIDIFWLHIWDFTTDIEELMRAFDDVVRSGKVLHIGISDTPAWIVAKANTIAESRGWTPFCALQIEYSLLERSPERDLLPMANHFGLTVTPWSPLGEGLLTGKYTDEKVRSHGRLQENSSKYTERNLAIAKSLDTIANRLEVPQSSVALNWIRQRHPNHIPIVGATSKVQILETLKCTEFEIPEKEIKELDEATKIDLGFPHNFLNRPQVDDVLFGGTKHQIAF